MREISWPWLVVRRFINAVGELTGSLEAERCHLFTVVFVHYSVVFIDFLTVLPYLKV